MTSDRLRAILGERVVGWGVGPDPFWMRSSGSILPSRFQTVGNLKDVFGLLEQAASRDHGICGDDQGNIKVQVRTAPRESGHSNNTRGACKRNGLGPWPIEVDQ